MFTLVVGAGVSLIAGFRSDSPGYGSNGTELKDFNDTFYKLDNIQTSVESLESGIRDTNSTDFGVFGVLNGLISGSWNTIRLLFSSLGFIKSVFQGMATFFGIPAFVITIISLFLTTLIAFAIYSAVFQREI